MASDKSLSQRSLDEKEKKGFKFRWKRAKEKNKELSRSARSKKSKWSRSAKSKKAKLSRRAKAGKTKMSRKMKKSKKSKGSSSKSTKSGKSSKNSSKKSTLSCLSCKRNKEKSDKKTTDSESKSVDQSGGTSKGSPKEAPPPLVIAIPSKKEPNEETNELNSKSPETLSGSSRDSASKKGKLSMFSFTRKKANRSSSDREDSAVSAGRSARDIPSSTKTNSQRLDALEKAERDIEKDIMEIAEERRKIWQFWHNAHLVPLTQFLLTVPPLAWSYFALVVCLAVKIVFVCFIFSMLVHSSDAPLVYLLCFLIIHIGSAFATVQVLAVGTKRMLMICASVDGAIIIVSIILLMFISSDKNGPGIIDVERVGGTTVAVAFLEILLLLNYYHLQFRAPLTVAEDPPGLPTDHSGSYSRSGPSYSRTARSHSRSGRDAAPSLPSNPPDYDVHRTAHRHGPRHHPHSHRHHHHHPGNCRHHARGRDISQPNQNPDVVMALPPHCSYLDFSGTESLQRHRYVLDSRSGEVRDVCHTAL